MQKVSKDLVYGIHVYTLPTKNKIPYQLTFERDLFFDRINVNLLPLIDPEKNHCLDLRELVCNSFVDYFKNNSNETVYFEVDLTTRSGLLKMIKFLKWFIPYKEEYVISFEQTITKGISYMEVYIKMKSQN